MDIYVALPIFVRFAIFVFFGINGIAFFGRFSILFVFKFYSVDRHFGATIDI